MPYCFLITCATGDIGRELCLFLAKNNHNLIITARNIERLELLAKDIINDFPNCNVRICSADLSNLEAAQAFIQLAQETKIDGIVFMPPRPPLLLATHSEEIHTEEFLLEQAIINCCHTPNTLLQALLPSMENSKLKSVVLMSGISSVKPSPEPQYGTFNVVRAEWNKVMETLSKNYRSIRFNMVSPDQVNTPKYQQKMKSSSQENTITETNHVIDIIYSRLHCEAKAMKLSGTNTTLEKGIATLIQNKQRSWCEFFTEFSCFTSSIPMQAKNECNI